MDIIIEDSKGEQKTLDNTPAKIKIEDNANTCLLTIGNNRFVYNISTDRNFKSLSQIKDIVQEHINYAIKSRKPFYINEYLERNYINIGKVSEDESAPKRVRFTAVKQ